jgi:threonine aldolase
VLEAIAAVNVGHAFGYGHDPYTHSVERRLATALGAPEAAVFFVFNGSGANVLCLRAALRPWEAAIVSENAHLQTDEVGAPEALAGTKLLLGETRDGKLTADGLARLIGATHDEHAVKPGLVSLTESTELGTLYGLDELRELSSVAHVGGLRVHIDGARFANAAAALGVSLAELAAAAGVDLLTFGGTKNGLMVRPS